MERTIIKIDRDKCIGCGLCVNACNEGAIGMVDKKAVLLRDDYCDGLGNCLPVCPTNAISFEKRKALAFNKEAVKEHKRLKEENKKPLACGCPGSNAKSFERKPAVSAANCDTQSALMQWPVQIKLVPVNAPYFQGAHLLVAADCAAYAYANFHSKFMDGKVTIIGCPKLDDVDYADKLTQIIKQNDIKSVTAVRMQVPCCGGIENAVKTASKTSGKFIPWQIYTLSTDGEILKD